MVSTQRPVRSGPVRSRASEGPSLNARIEAFLLERGAIAVGFATTETLAGGPPSVDLTYKLPGARSAVSFALAFKREHIRPYLAKTDHASHQQDNADIFVKSKSLSWELAEMLRGEGVEAKGTGAHLKYRKEIPDWEHVLAPDVSHRYIAVRSGVGSMGWSGNVGIKGYGTAIVLGTTLTTADLEATDPIPEDEGFCVDCKLCVAACAADMFEKEKSVTVEIGGVDFTYAARKNLRSCGMVCGGASGLDASGKWSTWSPGRFTVPTDDDDLEDAYHHALGRQAQRPEVPGGVTVVEQFIETEEAPPKATLTCGNCQIVCWGDRMENGRNVRLLRQSGCVVQAEDGSLVVMSADEAKKAVAEMEPERRSLYE